MINLKAIQRQLRNRLPRLNPASPWVRQAFARPAQCTLAILHHAIRRGFTAVARRGWWTPVFRSLLETTAPRLWLDHGIPEVEGPLRLRLGADVHLSGRLILRGFPNADPPPLLEIGNNVHIGRDSVITVGTVVVLGNNVRLAGRNLLAGFPGYPMDLTARAAGDHGTPDQLRAIHLGDDVWLGSGVIVLAGVTIGQGTVVGAGSVVTRSLPPRVLAGGNPARVLRHLGAVNDP